MPRRSALDRLKLQQAAQDNPHLPSEFIEQCLDGMAEPRETLTQFIPRSRGSTDQSGAAKMGIRRLVEFLKS